ncbi:MAG: hypothetical protein QOC67_6082, partial [Pseudonocardiales bacterium]|nr:hypothetical protein [Pseudonocardiales bacterium]
MGQKFPPMSNTGLLAVLDPPSAS